MVPPNGPAAARSSSTWIHWWSLVASANAVMRSWSTVSQSLVPISLLGGGGDLVEGAEGAHGRASLGARRRQDAQVTSEDRPARAAPQPRPGPPGPQGRCCTTTSTAACGRRRSSSWPPTAGTSCPPTDAEALGRWFREAADSGSLVRYLETFDHTVARDADRRTGSPGWPASASRTSPPTASCTPRCATRPSSTSATGSPSTRSSRPSRRASTRAPRRPAGGSSSASCSPRCATRPARARSPSSPSRGATAASPASTSPAPRRATLRPGTSTRSSTSSARTPTSPSTPGEAFGLPSIWQAIQWCGADRLGHGVRIIDDITVGEDGSVELGRLAAYVRDRRIPLEMCPASNLQTGAAAVDRRAPHRAAHRAALPGHRQHRQPADERHVDDRRDGQPGRDVRLHDGRPAVVHDQRDEVGVPALRRAARAHRRGHQAGVRRAGA